MANCRVGAHRIYHVNINCSSLERSLEFYCDGLGLVRGTRTTPTDVQPGDAFGLPAVQWDAWILHGAAGNKGVVLDLLEWQVPPPSGRPRHRATDVGFNRLCIAVPDLDATYERLVARGADCWSPPTEVDLGTSKGRLFIVSDPDGTQIEVVAGPDVRLSHIAINTSDLARSTRFYEQVMALRPVADLAPPPLDGALFRLSGPVELRASLLRDDRTGFMVELIEWLRPAPTRWGFRRANDLGIFRMAWTTHDIDRDYQALLCAGACCYTPPASLSMGPGIADLRALFFDDPDAVCLELIEPGRPA